MPASLPVPRRGPDGRFDLTEVSAWQHRMREAVETSDRIGEVRLVAGADVAYDRRADLLYAAAVVLDAATLAILETRSIVAPVTFPYLPGYLTLREAPAVLRAFSRLASRPDLLFVDAHGRAHPRRFGLACLLGLALDIPAIGVAKSLLVGSFDAPASRSGSVSPVVHQGERIGMAVRTRDGIAPVFVSIGHRVSLPTAVRWTRSCGAGFRIPEPTRRAHLAVNALRASAGGGRP